MYLVAVFSEAFKIKPELLYKLMTEIFAI